MENRLGTISSVRLPSHLRHYYPPHDRPDSSLKSADSRCEPIPAFRLLPGPSTCPAWPSAASASARCELFPTNRLTPASRNSGSGPGTMAVGAREQAASCGAFVLSRRLPAHGAPPSRTFPAGLIAKAPSNPRRTMVRCLWPGLPPQRTPGATKKEADPFRPASKLMRLILISDPRWR